MCTDYKYCVIKRGSFPHNSSFLFLSLSLCLCYPTRFISKERIVSYLKDEIFVRIFETCFCCFSYLLPSLSYFNF